MSLGDSKTVAGSWQPILVGALRAPSGYIWQNFTGGQSGSTVATAAASIAAYLAAVTPSGDVSDVLLNWGVNEMGHLPAEATWEANYLIIIDAVRAKWPQATVHIMRPWRQGFDADAATLHGWIDTVVAARAFAVVGPDEAIWLKGADDGATMTWDGVHYSTAGNAEAASQWLTALGF